MSSWAFQQLAGSIAPALRSNCAQRRRIRLSSWAFSFFGGIATPPFSFVGGTLVPKPAKSSKVAWVVMLVLTSERHSLQNTPRPALSSLVGWLRAPKENRAFEAHYWSRQLFISVRSDAGCFWKKSLCFICVFFVLCYLLNSPLGGGKVASGPINERAQKARTTRL